LNELEKISSYFKEGKDLDLTSPAGNAEKNLYSRWELQYQPQPFLLKGKSLELAGQSFKLPVPVKGRIGYFAWDTENNCASLLVETTDTDKKFLLRFNEGEPVISECVISGKAKEAMSQGGQLEAVYDVIDHLRKTDINCEILNISKKKFVEAADAVSEWHDSRTITSLKHLTISEIRELLKTASSDMAVDELSNQLSFALDGTYAAENMTGGHEKILMEPVNISNRTRWEIIRELEFISSYCQFEVENEKAFILLFKSAKVVGPPDNKDLPLKIFIEPDAPLEQGRILHVKKRGESALFGTFIVDIFDGNVLYGRLRCDFPDIAEKYFHELSGTLPKSPTEFISACINDLCASVRISADAKLSHAQIFALGIKPFILKPGNNSNSSRSVKLDNSQLEALNTAANNMNPIVLVQGPPGTGKTFVLEQVLRKLCLQGLRVLVAAPSNTAVDNICRRISDLPLLRFGNNSDSIAPDVAKRYWIGEKAAVDRFIVGRKRFCGGIYAGTNVGLLRDRIVVDDMARNGRYDVIIFDEAGMCSIEEFLLCAGLGKKAILFGDHQQLTPFPLPKAVHVKLNEKFPLMPRRIRSMTGISALEYLAEQRKIPVIMLQHSYRCQNPRLLRFASTLFYDAVVKTSNSAEYFQLPYHERMLRYPPSTMRFYSTSSLPEYLKNEQLCFDGRKPGLANKTEALICADIFYAMAKNYPLDEISIIAPYRKQVALIRETLSLEYLNSLFENEISHANWRDFLFSRIATVDSFQGGESDVVIISYVRSNNNEGIGFIDNPNRINVAHTRCRREVHIIGDLDCLKRQAKSEIFTRLERAFLRDGEIIEVSKIPQNITP